MYFKPTTKNIFKKLLLLCYRSRLGEFYVSTAQSKSRSSKRAEDKSNMAVLPSPTLVRNIIIYLLKFVVSLVNLILKKLRNKKDLKNIPCVRRTLKFLLAEWTESSAQFWHIAVCKILTIWMLFDVFFRSRDKTMQFSRLGTDM